MPFPDADNAIVPQDKVVDYLLNPHHPVGGPKATWFESIGYTIDNWRDLATDLLHVAKTVDDFVAKPLPYGVKYEVVGTIGRLGHRPAIVITVGIVEENNPPRLVTAYPG